MIQRAPRPQGFELHSLASTHFGILGKDENNDEDDHEKRKNIVMSRNEIIEYFDYQ